MKSKAVVYVAGPMAGCTYEEADGWRLDVRDGLPECDVRSPMRGKNFLRDLRTIPTGQDEHQSDELAEAAVDKVVSSQHAIVVRDHWDVTQADIIIANLGEADIVSIGTCFELAWCWEQQKPVIVVMSEGNPNNHPFVREAAYVVVETLHEAVVIARTLLNLEVYPE